MITDARAEEAFEYLRDTTAEIGQAKGELERAEILRKRTRKRLFLAAPDGPVAQREAFAEVHTDAVAADERYAKALVEFETIRASRS